MIQQHAAAKLSFLGTIIQIMLLDIVFSLGSVITAVGMVRASPHISPVYHPALRDLMVHENISLSGLKPGTTRGFAVFRDRFRREAVHTGMDSRRPEMLEEFRKSVDDEIASCIPKLLPAPEAARKSAGVYSRGLSGEDIGGTVSHHHGFIRPGAAMGHCMQNRRRIRFAAGQAVASQDNAESMRKVECLKKPAA
jgi:hypothetical protein